MDSVVCFHLITEPNAYLSNWYPSQFMVDGTAFNCAEQYIMHTKAVFFDDDTSAREILNTTDPSEMQELGRHVSNYDEDTWKGMRQLVAFRGLKAKFSQNPLLRERLISTGDAILAECARSDRTWGIGLGMVDPKRFAVSEWPGRNLLGFTLMMVRDEMRERFRDAEQKTPLLHAFAKRFAYAAKVGGEPAIIASISLEEMRSFGLEMDCGHSFEKVCRQKLGDVRAMELDWDRIDDSLVLGSAIFSQWRWFTHWANEGMTDDDVRWFQLAAERLGELTA